MLKILAICISLLVVIEGCATKPAYIEVKQQPGIVLVNNSMRIISYVSAYACAGQTSTKRILWRGRLEKNKSIFINVNDDSCMNVEVYSTDELLLGTQKNVAIPPQLRWVIH